MQHTIILAARNQMSTDNFNSQIMPIRGKPALAWVIEDIKPKETIIVVLNKRNTLMFDYLQQRYPDVKVALVDSEEEISAHSYFSIVNSLNRGMKELPDSCSLLTVVLGDTLCRNNPPGNSDMILVSDDFLSSKRWCLVEETEDRHIKKLYDKMPGIDTSNKKAVVGFYQFADVKLVRQIIKKALTAKHTQISDILSVYNKTHPIECVDVSVWFDLGHRSGMVKAQNHFYNSRDFNTLRADDVRGVITKTSANTKKLSDEKNWYESLPDELQVLAPRVTDFQEGVASASLSMELYGYPVLSELLILGDLDIEEWRHILKKLFEVHRLLTKYKGELSRENFYDLYLHKTWNRLLELRKQNPCWNDLWNYKTVTVNGKEYKNICNFEVILNDAIEKLISSVDVTVMHGDYCFSNILFDTNTFVCRLIDPRGRLGEQTIYGDPRYDIAKLRHSAVGNYDFAVHGLFRLTQDGPNFTVSCQSLSFQDQLTEMFDDMVCKAGYDINEIRLIEALLFTSMIPLHKDSIDRQKLFYLKAVQKINECFGDGVNE